ncbi:uncharacterized protein [Canis lupus baileyi]|uniref:uncharacterized protein isoform X3 n=1 Tax=Canis lupus baileyi TaxID=143281 RepID=UPI0018F30C19
MVSEKINKWRARRECHHTCAWPRNTCCAVSKSMPANKFVLKRRLVQTGTAPRNEPHEEDATWKQREEVPPASPGDRPQEKPSPPAPWSRTLSLRNSRGVQDRAPHHWARRQNSHFLSNFITTILIIALVWADWASLLYLQQSFKAAGWHQAIRVTQTTMMTFPGVQHPAFFPLSPHRAWSCHQNEERWERRILFPLPFKVPWASQE